MAFKICVECKEKNPIRIRRCKKCEAIFEFKVKKKKQRKESSYDWRLLAPGDEIKVASGGPVFIDKDKNELPMGYHGNFSVISIDDNGILAHGIDRCGFCHIWMGVEKESGTGVLKKPHKIYKLAIRV